MEARRGLLTRWANRCFTSRTGRYSYLCPGDGNLLYLKAREEERKHRKKKNLISGKRLSSKLLFFFLYEPDAPWLSTKSGDEPRNWTEE
jgi:hypothetical protein